MAWRRKKLKLNLGGNNIFENTEQENNFGFEKAGRKNSVFVHHKDSNSICVDPNHADSDQLVPANLKNIGSITYSADICAIEMMLSWIGKSKDVEAHALHTLTNNHALTVHLVHTPSLVTAP